MAIIQNYNLIKQLEDNQDKYRRLLDNIGSTYVIYSHKLSGEITFVSNGVQEVFGVTEQDVIGKPWNRVVNWQPGMVDKANLIVERLAKGKEEYINHKMCFMHPDGIERIISITSYPETDDAGHVISIDGICEDITEQSAMLEQLRLANNVVANTNDGIVITDNEFRIVDINPASLQLSGYSREELIGANVGILSESDGIPVHDQEFQEQLSQSGHWDSDICNRKKTGELYSVRLSVSAIKNDDNELKNYVFLFHDISYLKEREEELRKKAFSDALTGMPNRLVLNDRLSQALLLSARSANKLAVCYIDIDKFKQVNNTYGHDIGDKVLIEVSSRIKSAIRSDDTAARIGSDEFVLLLQNIGSTSEIQETIERILRELTYAPYSTPFSELKLSANVGVALPNEHDIDAEMLLRNAGEALLVAKQDGRNNYRIFEEEHVKTVLRILVVDDCPDYRALISSMLRFIYPDAIVDLHDPNVWDIDTPDIEWTHYDILLLDYLLGEENGIDWFNDRKEITGFPSTILLTGGTTNEKIIDNAIQSGMSGFLQKRTTTTKELREAIDNVRENYFTDALNPVIIRPDIQHVDKSVFGRYKLRGLLGKGATSNAYLAKGQDGDDVAIKIFEIKKEHTSVALQRFLEENRLLKKIDHPNVIHIIDFGGDDAFAYTILEYMPGGTLRDRLDRTITCGEAIGYAIEIAKGLQSIHEAGVVHRDIKPHNILFRDNDSLVITDLGAAKSADRQGKITKAGDSIGTPLYISPEQILNKRLDPRSDIYSLGILLYQMISGEHPFKEKEKDVMGLLYMHAYTDIEPSPDLSSHLNDIIQKMVAKNPDHRYQNISALLKDLDNIDELCKNA